MQRESITYWWLTIFFLGLSVGLILADVKLEFEVEKINIGICSDASIRRIKPQQYYHDFSFLATCTYSIRIKGSTELPPGTWLIIGLFYNDLRLNQVNKITTVEENGTFRATIGILKDDKKIFPGDYTIEVWYLPTRQDPDIQPKLQEFKEEIKKTQIISIWNDTTNLPLHLEVKRLIKFYLHLLSHINYLAKSLNDEFNKYFPQDMEKDKEGEKVKQEYKKAYQLYLQKQYDKIDYKKLCFKELCFVPNVKKTDFEPLKWSVFATSWKAKAIFFYNLARDARDRCLINPFPEIATNVTLIAESLLSYLNIYEKRLYGSPIENTDPLNPNPSPKSISVYKLYQDLLNTIHTTRNKILLSKDLKKPISLLETIKKIYSLYKKMVDHIDNIRLSKGKDIKKIMDYDNKFIKQQKKKLGLIEKDIIQLTEFAKKRKNQTLLQSSNILQRLISYLNLFYKREGILNYTKFLKEKSLPSEDFLENVRMYRNNFLISLKNLLESIGNQELYLSLNLEEEIKNTSMPQKLTRKVEKEIEAIFSVFKTEEQQNPDLFTKSYLSLKNYDNLVTKYILKNKTLDSEFKFVRIYSIHYLMEQNAITIPEVEKVVLNHIEKWFDDKRYDEELGYLYEVLIRNANEKYLNVLHKGLTHKNATIRTAAIVGITKIGSPKSLNVLITALKDESPVVRGYAKDGLELLIENPIELDVKTIDPKTEEGKKKIEALIEKITKEIKEK